VRRRGAPRPRTAALVESLETRGAGAPYDGRMNTSRLDAGLPRATLSVVAACLGVVLACTSLARAQAASTPPDSGTAVAELRDEAKNMKPLVRSKLAHDFLDATTLLPHIQPRTVLYDSSRTHYYWESEADALPDSAHARLITRTLDEHFYYNTRYGSPLAYVRALDLLAEAGLGDIAGRRIADYGYGGVGHLRLLASLGAQMVGIEVDPLLDKLYSLPGDQGTMRDSSGREGRVTLVHGSFPGDPKVADKVGQGLRLFLSKNTLKNGYLHPAQPVNPRMLVHLGVEDSAYVRTLARVVEPGGFVMIYNLCPAPAPPDKPYIPWADGRCPFPRAMWESAGFRVLQFDRDDTPFARRMGHALGWDQGPSPMDLEKDLFATYTLVTKPRK
jgi:hypothetical protein